MDITKLVTQFIDKNTFIVYETNITDINIISTDYFNPIQQKNDNLECLFKKNNISDEKLLFLCKASVQGKGSIGEIAKIKLNHLNILYNFIIVGSKNEEEYIVSDKEGTIISSVYPEELDFNSKDSYIIRYITDYPERLKDIKLNCESPDILNCENKKGFKQCNVSKSHFNKEGNYHTYYNNSFGSSSIAYEASTVKIILKENKPDDSKKNLAGIIAGSVIGGVALIGIIIFLVVRYYKKKKAVADDFSGKSEDILPTQLMLN